MAHRALGIPDQWEPIVFTIVGLGIGYLAFRRGVPVGAPSLGLPQPFPCTIDPTTGDCVTTEIPPGIYTDTPAGASTPGPGLLYPGSTLGPRVLTQ